MVVVLVAVVEANVAEVAVSEAVAEANVAVAVDEAAGNTLSTASLRSWSGNTSERLNFRTPELQNAFTSERLHFRTPKHGLLNSCESSYS